MNIELHQEDLPNSIIFDSSIAIDTEAMGLDFQRDRLCLIQIYSSAQGCHLIQFQAGSSFNSPNLKKLLLSPSILKIFHFARFDVGILQRTLNISLENVYCTKIASKLVRTYTERHGLKDLCRELLGVEISKMEQSSDWGAEILKPEQLKYAASDVLYLHLLKEKLDKMLVRENRMEWAQRCFDFLPIRSQLDSAGWSAIDIFQH